MKKTTVKKYENFIQACRNESVISNVRQLAKAHSVSVTFTDWLIKNRYLVKLAGGSYKLMATLAKANNVVRLYENRNEPKQAKPVDRSEVMKEISKKADEMQDAINEINALKSVKEREAEAIKLLKSIESDLGVSYSLTRTETTKTVLL